MIPVDPTCSPTVHPSEGLTMKTELSRYAPGGGVTVFQAPPVKCNMTGQSFAGAAGHVAVAFGPPPTTQASPPLFMKTLLRLFVTPIVIPLVHMNPFQWKMVGSANWAGPLSDSFPTAQPSFGFMGPVNGGPKLTEVKLLMVELVTDPQLLPSK